MRRGFIVIMALALSLPGLGGAAHAGAVYLGPGQGTDRE